jgi:hypothetical protein
VIDDESDVPYDGILIFCTQLTHFFQWTTASLWSSMTHSGGVIGSES